MKNKTQSLKCDTLGFLSADNFNVKHPTYRVNIPLQHWGLRWVALMHLLRSKTQNKVPFMKQKVTLCRFLEFFTS